MSFTSLNFVVFLCLTLIVYYLFPQKYKYIAIAVASTAFYFIMSKWLIALLFIVAVISYVGGLSAKRKMASNITVVMLVGVLAFFKYAGFLEKTVRDLITFAGGGSSEMIINLALPIGISFYVFEAISYIVECKKDENEPEKNFLMVYTFLSFFATIVSGPIERANHLIPQFKNPSKRSFDEAKNAFLLILWGFFLKLVLANRLSIFVNGIFDSPSSYAGTVVFIGTIFYSIEIYADFAGYSCIAVGVASLFGIDMVSNFESPYLSESISEFWRRWHISLSSWLRDYLYIPLGGNRKGKIRKIINLLIVFLISGIWHGASWTFVFWGFLHGIYQVVAIIIKPLRDKVSQLLKTNDHLITSRVIKVVLTFLLVNFAWIFFRADSFANAFEVIKMTTKITPWVFFDGSLFTVGLSRPDINVLVISIILLLIIDVCNRKNIQVREYILKQSLPVRWLICISVILFIAICGVWGPGYNSGNFIYMGF